MVFIKLLFLALGTFLSFAYIVLTAKGKKYDPLIANLPDEGYSDKELWAAGYALQDLPMFGAESAIGKRMRAQAKLLHPENEGKFVEYWARLYFARTLSLILIVAAVICCVTGMMDDTMAIIIPIFGAVAVYAVYDSGINAMKKELDKRSEECLLEFSNVVSKLSLVMGCGMNLRNAWFNVAYSKTGPIYDLMRNACNQMNNGVSETDAIYAFGMQSNTPQIRKFAGVLIQSSDKSSANLIFFLKQQASELWSNKRQMMLKKGDEAAAKLLVPTMLILAGILIIILASALAGLNFNF